MNTSARNISAWRISQFETIELLSFETASLIVAILQRAVIPLTASFGVIGNIISLMVLSRHGLNKSSNILLATLAFTDVCFLASDLTSQLLALANVTKLVFDGQGSVYFLHSKIESYCLYIFFTFISNFVRRGFAFVSLTIPLFITIERLIAVYFPLKLTTIVTPRRTWATLTIATIYSLFYRLFEVFYYEFEYVFNHQLNSTVGVMSPSVLLNRIQSSIKTIEQIFVFSSLKLQPVLTFVGCILIIVKVKTASKKRQRMTTNKDGKKATLSKTTQTLLAVCFIYLFVCAAIVVPSYIPAKYMVYSVLNAFPTNLNIVLNHVSQLLVCVNSSSNFVIYIGINKNFRDIFKEIFVKCL